MTRTRNALCIDAAAALLLAITIGIAHYWHSGSFGLYEDDWFRIGRILPSSWGEVLQILLEGGGQGRPLHDGFIYLFSFLGIRLGGIEAAYAIGYGIQLINTILFYFLLKRLTGNADLALAGALLYALFPADTTDAFLTHSLGIQPSLLFLLTAFHLWLSGRRSTAYGVITLTLFCYETAFPVFLAAPLLSTTRRPEPITWRRILRHSLLLITIFLAVIALRRLWLGGMGVAADLGLAGVLQLALSQMVIGPAVSLAMMLLRPLQAPFLLDAGLLPPLLLFVAVLVLGRIAWIRLHGTGASATSGKSILQSNGQRQGVVPGAMRPRRWLIAGAMMLVLAYPLALTVPAAEIDGRETRVHAMAGIGASLLAIGIMSVLSTPSWPRNGVTARQALFAVWLTLLVCFSLSVQRDYATAWRYQQAFWSDLLRLCTDIEEGTVILLASSDRLNQPEQIDAQGWSVPVVLTSIYDFPDDWSLPPRVYKLKDDWKRRIVSDDGSLALDAATEWLPFLKPRPQERTSSSNVILLDAAQGRLNRRPSVRIGSYGDIPLRKPGMPMLPSYRTTHLHAKLIQPGARKPADYLLPR
jgi:hypothetical protein